VTPSYPTFVQLYGITQVTGKLTILMEIMEGGDLRRALDQDTEGLLHWHRMGKGIAMDIARGIQTMQAHNVIHRDLKSKNVLLTTGTDGTVGAKLADFGAAAVLTDG